MKTVAAEGPQSEFSLGVMQDKYAHSLGDGSKKESWRQVAHRVSNEVFTGSGLEPSIATPELIKEVEDAIAARQFMPGGRYLAASGRKYHQVQNCALYRVEDSREGWAKLMYKITMALMSGAGVGVVYSDLRGRNSPILRTGGVSTGPCALMYMVNEAGRGIIQGGNRRSAIWAGLHWNHSDVLEFIHQKDWSEEIRAAKLKDYNAPAPLDQTNISVILDDDFFAAYEDEKNPLHKHAREVFWETVKMGLRTGEPGFSIDTGENTGENLRNACTEITSRDDSDICNLGSINMARVTSLEEMRRLVRLATTFLLAGTLYSDVPHEEILATRRKNRRLGLGLMGLHEWLLQRGKAYGPDAELEEYLKVYATSGGIATELAKQWGISAPVKTRAIAPTGTIGIVAETTTGIEPIFCAAYKRRYIKDGHLHYQYVVDPTAKRLVDSGLPEEKIEDAYTLSEDVERRLSFQAWLQQYVDHAISSTINMPSWDPESNNNGKVRSFGLTLMKYLPQLRGVTIYPDGARSGQPLQKVKYSTAMGHLGEVFMEQADLCDISKGGSCGA